jgi:hypothetical protein
MKTVQGLVILNSSYVGSRDLWWPVNEDDGAVLGYNVYRAFDAPTNWQKLNDVPLPVRYYRDQTTILKTTYDVQPQDWITKGELGNYIIHIPEIPYAKVMKGRPVVSNSPQDVAVVINGTQYRPSIVNALDQTIWLQVDNTLPVGGYVSDYQALPIPALSDPTTTVQIIYFRLANFVDIFTNMVRTFYTVIPVDAEGNETHAPGVGGTAIVDTYQVDTMDYMQAEMVRRNQWLFEQVGEPAWLMFRKIRGKICGCTRTGLGEPRTVCPACYETGIVGGYYGPYAFLYIDPDQAVTRELQEGGIKVRRESRSYLGPSPVVQDGDLIIRRNGERLVINGVTYKMPRGVLLQQEYTSSLLPGGDTRYIIPVVKDLYPPQVYNPADLPEYLNPATGVVTGQPVPGTEPINEKENEPNRGKNWDNKNKQVGKTITFGRILTSNPTT